MSAEHWALFEDRRRVGEGVSGRGLGRWFYLLRRPRSSTRPPRATGEEGRADCGRSRRHHRHRRPGGGRLEGLREPAPGRPVPASAGDRPAPPRPAGTALAREVGRTPRGGQSAPRSRGARRPRPSQ